MCANPAAFPGTQCPRPRPMRSPPRHPTVSSVESHSPARGRRRRGRGPLGVRGSPGLTCLPHKALPAMSPSTSTRGPTDGTSARSSGFDRWSPCSGEARGLPGRQAPTLPLPGSARHWALRCSHMATDFGQTFPATCRAQAAPHLCAPPRGWTHAQALGPLKEAGSLPSREGTVRTQDAGSGSGCCRDKHHGCGSGFGTG